MPLNRKITINRDDGTVWYSGEKLGDLTDADTEVTDNELRDRFRPDVERIVARIRLP